jgi:hypothetical protein
MAIGVHGPTICLPPALHNVRLPFAVENSLIAKSAGDWGFSTQYKKSRAIKAGLLVAGILLLGQPDNNPIAVRLSGKLRQNFGDPDQ